MKKRKIAVFVMGLSLPLWGWFAGAVLRLFFSTGFLCLVSLVVLAVWALMGFFAEDILEDTVQAVFFLNLPLSDRPADLYAPYLLRRFSSGIGTFLLSLLFLSLYFTV